MSPSTGVVGNLRRSSEEVCIEWQIADFFSTKYLSNVCSSRVFDFAGASWNLRLFPQSEKWPGCMVLFLMARPRGFSVSYVFGLKRLDGTSEELVSGNLDEQKTCTDCAPFIAFSDVLQQKCELTTSDAFTVTCTLKKGNILVNKPKFKRLIKLDALSANFKNLYANKDSCDVTLLVKDIEYKAYKAVLIARSPVFAATFLHEMSEKQTGVVKIPDCDTESFEKFLKFLYCGKLKKLSYQSAFQLYVPSDKYDVQDLKTFCIEVLMENLVPENFYDIAYFADKYNEMELISAVQDFFNENANKIFHTSEWGEFLKNGCHLAHKLLRGMPQITYAKKQKIV